MQEGRLDPRKADLVAQAKQRFTQTYLEQRCYPLTDRINLLTHFARDYKLGCVTNCIKHTTTEILRRTGLQPFFQAVVTNEDVSEPKPSPQPYHLACGLLEIEPPEALVFEDHDVGVTAAFNAHCAVRKTQYHELTVALIWGAIQETNAYLKEGINGGHEG